MDRNEKIAMIVGASLIVIGTISMAACFRALDRLALQTNTARTNKLQEVWLELTEMDFYKNADDAEQQLYYDAFWTHTKKD